MVIDLPFETMQAFCSQQGFKVVPLLEKTTADKIVKKHEKYLDKDRIKVLDKRKALSVQEYEKVFYEETHLDDSGSAKFSGYEDQEYALVEILEHHRYYSKVEK